MEDRYFDLSKGIREVTEEEASQHPADRFLRIAGDQHRLPALKWVKRFDDIVTVKLQVRQERAKTEMWTALKRLFRRAS